MFVNRCGNINRFEKYIGMNPSTNKMDTNLTGMWVSFFTAAGIPSDVSATYALTFSENRIQNDMLLDLNKEYLKDMGIVRMGDVIAILRHAKQVHESAARDKVLSTAAGSNKVPVAAVTGRATLAQPSSPASRILEHYTRNPNSPDTSSASVVKLKRKAAPDVSTNPDINIKKSRTIRFESPTRVASAPKETPIATKQTVFSRLGNSEAVKVASLKPASKQIYLRLGSKADSDNKDQDIPIQKDALKYEGILKGSPPAKQVTTITKKVFTVTTNQNNQRKIAIATMRADEAPVSVKDKLALPKTKSVKFSNQVQYKEIEANKKIAVPIKTKIVEQKFTQVFNKPERRLSMPEVVAENSGVKARLGNRTTKTFTITRDVFNRLGA